MYIYIYIQLVLIYCSLLESTSDSLKKSTLKNVEQSNETELVMGLSYSNEGAEIVS